MKMLEHNPEKIKKKTNMTPEQAKEYTSHNTGTYSYDKLREESIKRKKK